MPNLPVRRIPPKRSSPPVDEAAGVGPEPYHLKDKFALVSKLSEDFASKADRVSDQMAACIDFFDSLPGKAEVHVKDSIGNFLSFNRDRNEWVLSFSGPSVEEETICKNLPVRVKAIALTLIPSLLDRLLEVQTEAIDTLHSGLAAMYALKLEDV